MPEKIFMIRKEERSTQFGHEIPFALFGSRQAGQNS
jgi:hypothetical protein